MNPITYPQEYTAEMHQYIESIEPGYKFNRIRYPLYVALLILPLGIKGALDGVPRLLFFIVSMYLLFLVFYVIHRKSKISYIVKTTNKANDNVTITESKVRIENEEGFAIEHPLEKCTRLFKRGAYYLVQWDTVVVFIPEKHWNSELEGLLPPICKRKRGYAKQYLSTDITWIFIILLTIYKLLTMPSEG